MLYISLNEYSEIYLMIRIPMRHAFVIIILFVLFTNKSSAQLLAADDAFYVPASGLLLVEPFGIFQNDSLNGETEVDGMEASLVSDVSFGTLECVVRNGDDVISRTPGICSDGSFDYTAGSDFFGTDSFVYQLSFTGYPSQNATVFISACSTGPEVFICWKEVPYQDLISTLGYGVIRESFEGVAWDSVRNTSLPSVTNNSITWRTNHPSTNNIITNNSTAHLGQWGVFDQEHGYATGSPGTCDVNNPPEICLLYDGLAGESNNTLFAVGAYVTSVVPFSANISFLLDGTAYNVGKMFDYGHQFFGVINTAGFQSFQLREIDGKIGQEIPVFMDDFIIATSASTPINTAPMITSVNDVSVDENEYVSIDISASDSDDGDVLQFSVIGLPIGANFDDLHDGTAALYWRPDFTQAGVYPITVQVTDSGSPPLNDSVSFDITVVEVNGDLIFKDGFEL